MLESEGVLVYMYLPATPTDKSERNRARNFAARTYPRRLA
jgi:hypothetical protein